MRWPFTKSRTRRKAVPRRRAFAAARESDSFDLPGLIGDSLRPVDADIRAALPALRRKARTEFESSSDARRAVALLRRNVVGHAGIALSIDHPAGEAVQAAFREHSRPGMFETSGRLSRCAVEGLIVNQLCTDGEFLARWHGESLELLDPHQIPIDTYQERQDGTETVMGVRLDRGRPVGYFVGEIARDRGGYLSYTRPTRAALVSADEIVHVFVADFPKQTRGWPMLNTALTRLGELREYEIAELRASVFASRKLGFFQDGEHGEAFTGDDVDDDGTPIIEATDGPSFSRLPAGVEAKAIGWEHPHGNFAAFTGSHRRAVAGALDVESADLSGDYSGANFSGLRAGRLAAQEGYKSLQQLLIDGFTRPVYARWLRAASLSGQVDGVTPATFRALLQATEFQGRRWENLQPREHARGQQIRLALGLTSLSEEIRNEGRDPRAVLRQRTADRAALLAAGVPLETVDNIIPLASAA